MEEDRRSDRKEEDEGDDIILESRTISYQYQGAIRDESLLPFEPEIAVVPPGPFRMGDDDLPLAAPQHTVDLPMFFISRYPITNEQFAHFVWKTAHVAAGELLWDGMRPPAGQEKHPVTGVTWYLALSYCQWLSAETGRAYTLPSEAQWEKAARGADGRLFPWGDAWNPNRCNTDRATLTAVDAFPSQSPSGCYDMVGNAREWTTTLWGTSFDAPDERYRFPWADDGRQDLAAPPVVRRVFRGGRGDSPAEYRCSARGSFRPEHARSGRNRLGFRVVCLDWKALIENVNDD